MAHSRAWLVALVAATAAPATALAVALPDDVTIRAQLSTDPGTGTYELDISGTIASNASGETIDVLAKECGPANRHYRLVAGARTAAGGSWVVVTGRGGVDLVQLPINSYFRARWRGHLSSHVLVRVPAFVTAAWRPRRRVVEVAVSTGFSGQSLRGRFVELQRKVEATGTWVRVRRARLGRGAYARYLGLQFKTRFSVRARGLTLRILVPGETGAPCYTAGLSQTRRS
jgi:hypothetical protein